MKVRLRNRILILGGRCRALYTAIKLERLLPRDSYVEITKARVALDWTLDLLFTKDLVHFMILRSPVTSHDGEAEKWPSEEVGRAEESEAFRASALGSD